ncbi:helix-turn-helix domain-containing protein [Paenibacillus aurantiacus]|uniref:Helix-turn-helix domain-containing protein n=1 Tax=Paenibacillus aurantiacus TaxID=1936118 RepID=A0ABV5KUE3_9BACL
MTYIQPIDLKETPLYYAHRRTSTNAEQFQGTFHAHQGVEILLVHEGRGTLILDGVQYEVGAGCICVFQPYQLHHVQMELSEEQPFVRSIVHYEPSSYDAYLTPWPALQTFFRHLHKGKLAAHVWLEPDLESVAGTLLDLDERCLGLPRDRRMEECSLFLIAFFRVLKPLWEKRHQAAKLEELRKPHQAERMIEWLDHHYREPLRLTRMSRDLHLSTYHLSHLFKASTGSSITDYLTAKRMQQAVLLLQSTDMAVARIAEEVGMMSASHFCKVFKDHYGMTPYRYRKRWSEQPLVRKTGRL